MKNPEILAFPIFLLLIVFEALWITKRQKKPYPWLDGFVSTVIAFGQPLTRLLTVWVATPVFQWVAAHRLTEIPSWSAGGFLAVLLLHEFIYYWFHRFSHEVRWLWATHAVHHSATELNFSAAYRLGWTNWLSGGWVFLLPLVWLGFDYRAVQLTVGINLIYQFWLHTEIIPKMGILELVLNTPSHHRVHHAMNTEYLDKNYGGIVIIFDRLFGTFAEEKDESPCRYGVLGRPRSLNPLTLNFREWSSLLEDVLRARTAKDALRYAFGRPGWRANESPDRTSAGAPRAQVSR